MARAVREQRPPPSVESVPDNHIHVHGPPKPYIVFTDAEGTPHFMEFEGIHLYCTGGNHNIQDRFGRHYEVSGAYDIMDPAQALQTYQMMCAAAQAARGKG